MSQTRPSLSPTYFEAIYAQDADPWSFATSAYEHEKYDATLAALAGARFGQGFEVGCSIGVLTRRLAGCCDHLLAIDVAEAALAQARIRCADLPQVRIARMQVPEAWPDGPFNLIVLSEVLYYFDAAGIGRLAERVIATAAQDASVLLVHWIGLTDYPTGGDAAVEQFIAACAPRTVCHQSRTARYRLDLLR